MRLFKLTEKVWKEMRGIGIPVSENIEKVVINKRTRKRLGACFRETSVFGKEKFTIEISERVLNCNDFQLCSIIAHELLHTCPGSFDHGKKWKKFGEKTETLLGYHIKRTINTEELDIPDFKNCDKFRYTVICQKCGQKYKRKKLCPLVKNPEKYKCGKCGGKLRLM